MKTVAYTKEDTFHSLREKISSVFSDSYNGCVLALGFFDGVHLAHRRLIEKAKAEANRLKLPLVIFTFSGKSLSLKSGAERLYSDEEKLSLLEECFADAVILTEFCAVSELSVSEFVTDFIINTLDTRVAVAGYNFRFGKEASGSSSDLEAHMKKSGRGCILMEMLTDSDLPISSTRIRELLHKKDMAGAAKLLGKPYFITGKVKHGLGLGKTLGIPTVNTELPDGNFSVPSGVYLSALSVGGENHLALTNIGVCPTFGRRAVHAETYILDFDGDLYGENLRIYLCAHLRDEKKFDSENELISQIKSDTDKALALWEDIKWQEIGLN